MAVARLNKVRILVHRSRKDELLGVLQEEGALELIDLSSRLGEGLYAVAFKEAERPQAKTAGPLEELGWLISSLGQFDKAKRYILTREEFRGIVAQFDHSPLYKRCRELEAEIKEIDDKRRALLGEAQALEPWKGLQCECADLARTSYTVRGLGVIKKESLELLEREAEAEGLDLSIERVTESNENAYAVWLFLRADEERVSSLFKRHNLTYVYFPHYSKSPARTFGEIGSRVRELELRRQEALETLRELAKEKRRVFVLYDHLAAAHSKELAAGGLLRTEEVYLIEGWVRRRDAQRLRSILEARFPELELELEEPAGGDDVPVLLENPVILQPFEFITKIYGMPAYHEVDPTPFLAPFFFIFFGFCITDAAYGIILVLFASFMLKRFKMGWQGSRFFRLLRYGGVSTVVLGAVTGGWFGDLLDEVALRDGKIALALKAVKDSIILLDPMKDPMRLLIAALTLGVTQIWCGNLVALYGNLKNRRYLDALLDQGSILTFLLGFTGLILGFLNAIPKELVRPSTAVFIAGALAITATQGRSNPTAGSKLFYGVYALYNAFSGYLSDILSYSRLWALGLVTGVMASAVNLIAFLMGGMVPLVGVAIAAAILVGGHLVTLVMNLLGAFVHPARLQFVEFFSKFFRGGGREFKPLRVERRYTVIE